MGTGRISPPARQSAHFQGASGGVYAPGPMFADRYELGAALGRGGMAEVFEAVAHGAHGFLRRVAIKRLLPEFCGDTQLVRMFLDEARTASHLHHSGIVGVLDFGAIEGSPFQVLELVEGWDAARLVRMAQERKTNMPIEVALVLANQVAHALAYAHSRKDDVGRPLGIVHRDVKPSNILVSRSGDIKLGDFGIALARERSAVSTGFLARGTPGYMSPEQLLGNQVGPAADIFAMGITLHGLVTGASPLQHDGHRVLLSGEELTLSPDLPLDVREIIVRAVRIRPDERYASAREMAHAIGEALAPRLETDPMTRITQWLEGLEAKREESERTTTAILVPMAAPGQFAMRSITQPSSPVARPVVPLPTVDIPPLRVPPTIPEMMPPDPMLTPVLTSAPMPSLAPPPSHADLPPPSLSGSRKGTIFAIAILVPLGIALLALALFLLIRLLGNHARSSAPPITPDAAALAPTEPGSASPSSALDREPIIPEEPLDVGSKTASKAEGPELVVSSVTWKAHPKSQLELLNATPAQLKDLVATMTAAVKQCLVGQRVRRGAYLIVTYTLGVDGHSTYSHAVANCQGKYCKLELGDWVSGEALTCAARTFRLIPFPRPKPGVPPDEGYSHDFMLR
jgi:serine/threonine protein kinase